MSSGRLVLALLAIVVGAATALEYPYSVAIPQLNATTQLAACANASGFAFPTNTTPNAHQLSRMCGDPNCGSLANSILSAAGVTHKDQAFYDSLSVAKKAFVWPIVQFCWYYHLPSAPCPSEFLPDFFDRFKDQFASCTQALNVSWTDLNTTRLQSHVVKFVSEMQPCPIMCNQVVHKLYYATELSQCSLTHGSVDLRVRQFLYAITNEYCFSANHAWDAGIYIYQPDWPVPPVPEETTAPPRPPTDPSGSDDHDNDNDPNEIVVVGDLGRDRNPRSGKSKTRTLPSPSPSVEEGTDAPPSSGTITKAVQLLESSPPTSTALPTSPSEPTMETDRPPLDASTTTKASDHRVLYGASIGAAVSLAVVLAIGIRTRRRVPVDLKDSVVEPYTPTLSPFSATTSNAQWHLLSSDSVKLSQSSLIPGLRPVPREALEDLRLIGTGGHGVVYLVRDSRTNQLLASKRLAKNHVTKERIAAFVDEIQLVATLEHACIVTFIGASWTNRVDVQALFEFMEGGDLRTYLDVTPVEPWTDRKFAIAIDIADALAYVHTALATPVVHRDLKSRNVLLTKSQDRAKLSDFGVARSVSHNLSMTTGVGTSRWLAPEVIVGGGDYNAACDIYSFGVVLSELDTHRVPFSDVGNGLDTFMPEIAILSMVGLDGLKPTFADTCPPELLTLAQQCLSYNPQERPSANDVATSLRQIREARR